MYFSISSYPLGNIASPKLLFFLIFENSKIPFLETFVDKYNPQTQKYMSGLPKAAETEQKLSK